VLVDDATRADMAAQHIRQGRFLVYRGDYHNARQLLKALQSRVVGRPKKKKPMTTMATTTHGNNDNHNYQLTPVGRLWQEQRRFTRQQTRLLNRLLVQVIVQRDGEGAATKTATTSTATANNDKNDDGSALSALSLQIPFRRAPPGLDQVLRPTLLEALRPVLLEQQQKSTQNDKGGEKSSNTVVVLVPLREVLGMIGAHQWSQTGIWIPDEPHQDSDEARHSAEAPRQNGFFIYPHYGVFAPTRREYLDLFLMPPPFHPSPPPTPQLDKEDTACSLLDVGTGTGVLAALLLRRYGTKRFSRVVLTDSNPHALACARDNLERMELMELLKNDADDDNVVQLQQTHGEEMFPHSGQYDQKFDWIVCNPPWIPGPADSWLDQAVYDSTNFLPTFLSQVETYLRPQGQVWLVLSNFGELLGLRPPLEELLMRQQSHQGNSNDSNLIIANVRETKPWHNKANRARKSGEDELQRLRASEVTRLYTLMRASDAA